MTELRLFQFFIDNIIDFITRNHSTIPPYRETRSPKQLGQRFGEVYVLCA
jgi:hypothetical protein